MALHKDSRHRTVDLVPFLDTIAKRRRRFFDLRSTTLPVSQRGEPYQVKAGEADFALLAHKFYGSAALWWVLADANPKVFFPLDLKDGDIINVPSSDVANALR